MRAWLFLLGMLVLLNCKDPINIEGEGSIGALVVDGKITTLPGPYEVKLGLTVGISQKPNPISMASVTVFDDAGNSESYVETLPGVYSNVNGVMQGVAGRAYHVEVTLPNGRKYSSVPEIIPMATGTTESSYDFGSYSTFVGETEVKTSVINVYVDSKFPANTEKPLYFRWDVAETYMFEQTPIFNPFLGGLPPPCYVSGFSDPQRITLYNTKNQVVSEKKHTLIAVRKLDYAFLAKHFFNISMNSITAESYNYWQHVDQLINRSGSIFDTPPAPIRGNISSDTDKDEIVFGYFEASNSSLSRFYTLRSDIPVSLYPYCNDPQYGLYWNGYPQACSYCLSLDNSTLVPPEYFDDPQYNH